MCVTCGDLKGTYMSNSGDLSDAVQWLYVTVGSTEEAETIARTLVSERLVACANILGPMRSFYWWNDAVQNDAEIAVVLKTRRALLETATQRIQALHSYDCPCIVALDIQGGNADFIKWIINETQQ